MNAESADFIVIIVETVFFHSCFIVYLLHGQYRTHGATDDDDVIV